MLYDEYAAILWALNTQFKNEDEAWSHSQLWNVTEGEIQGTDRETLLNKIMFAIKNPLEANRMLHEAHLKNPSIRQDAIDYLSGVLSSYYEYSIDLLAFEYFRNTPDEKFQEDAEYIRGILSDLDISIEISKTFGCDHTVPDSLYLEHLRVKFWALGKDKEEKDVVAQKVVDRLKPFRIDFACSKGFK